MVQDLVDFVADEPIFVDANIFLFHAFDDEEHGKAATSFLVRIEDEEINALTSSLVIDEVFLKILVQEAAAHLKRPTVWSIKQAIRRKPSSRRSMRRFWSTGPTWRAWLSWG
jgi:predicted nucleic acid-binding protein